MRCISVCLMYKHVLQQTGKNKETQRYIHDTKMDLAAQHQRRINTGRSTHSTQHREAEMMNVTRPCDKSTMEKRQKTKDRREVHDIYVRYYINPPIARLFHMSMMHFWPADTIPIQYMSLYVYVLDRYVCASFDVIYSHSGQWITHATRSPFSIFVLIRRIITSMFLLSELVVVSFQDEKYETAGCYNMTRPPKNGPQKKTKHKYAVGAI